MHKVLGSFLLSVLLASTALAKTPTVVDEDARKAKVAFQQGLTNYNLSHFDEALVEFEKAYRLKADPAFLFNIAQCHRQLNRPQEAIRSYRAFLRESAADSPGRDEVQRLIGEMEKLIAARDQAAAQPPTGVQSPANSGATLAPQPEATPSLTASAPPPPEKKKSKKWVWVTVGVVGGLAVAGAAVGLGLGLSGNGSAPHTTLGNFGVTFQ